MSRRRKRSEAIVEVDDDVVLSTAAEMKIPETGGGEEEKHDLRDRRLHPSRRISVKYTDRLYRALGQRMYLIDQTEKSTTNDLRREYTVLGSTGNVYKVEIGKIVSCNCPDQQLPCKHIIFVMLRCMHLF